MTILTLRTDKPEAELGIYIDGARAYYIEWPAHLKLSKTIHRKIEEILNKSSISVKDIQGIVCYAGPGSFTGLRIGLSVANALAYAQSIPIVATGGQTWIEAGIEDLEAGKSDKIALPEYGRPAATTPPKK